MSRDITADAAGTDGGIPIGERRPTARLLHYYVLQSLLAGPFFVFPLIPLYFKYHTLRYVFDAEGVSMRWGVLFRREVSLTYARIQDLHLVSNIFERWLGLGRIQVQTASGSAKAEMTIEGLPDFEELRDRLYSRMRGAGLPTADTKAGVLAVPAASLDAIADAVQTAAAHLGALRRRLEETGTRAHDA